MTKCGIFVGLTLQVIEVDRVIVVRQVELNVGSEDVHLERTIGIAVNLGLGVVTLHLALGLMDIHLNGAALLGILAGGLILEHVAVSIGV